ncbi:hypothetical protein [Nitrosovibrio sp. Nv17]|nr:hypothetical protein [Nitrosovibrio sp. Nv17]
MSIGQPPSFLPHRKVVRPLDGSGADQASCTPRARNPACALH